MSNMKNLLSLLEDLEECGQKLSQTAASLKEYFSDTESAKPAPAEEKAQTLTKEKVREILADKAAAEDGKYKAQVKDLVKKYANGGALKDIPEDQYSALIDELGVIGDA